MASRTGNPTIKDVARACGVSEATVSYVINGKRVLRADTRERISRTMAEMNYHPSAVARGLATKRLHTLGVLLGAVDPIDFMVNHYAAGVLQGVVARAQKDSFNVTLFTERWTNAAESGPAMRDGRTDGILVIGPHLYSDVLDCLWSYKFPTVAVSALTRSPIPVVDVDDYKGAVLATEHLIGLGHRKIAHLSGNADLASHLPRLNGYRDALDAAGIEPDPRLFVVSDFNGSITFDQAMKLLALDNPPTAVFAGNDTIALRVIDAARASGLDVPRRLSVIGYDDMQAATLVTPGLTTIRQPFIEIGRNAASLLIDQVHDRSAHIGQAPVLIAPELVVRGTTAPRYNN